MSNKRPWGGRDPLFEYLAGSDDIIADLDFETRRGFKNGVMVRPQSYGRVGLHIPTNTFLVAASKAEHNLRGPLLPNGREQATKDGVEAGYVIAAFRSKGSIDQPIQERSDFRNNAGKQYLSFRSFCSAMQRNTKAQYHLRGFSHAGYNFFTNGNILYTISPEKGHNRRVSITVPVPRDGKEEGIRRLNGNNSFRNGYGTITQTLCITRSNVEARERVLQHWEGLSSRLWDEVANAKYEDMRLKKFGAETYNAVIDHSGNIAGAAVLFGVGGYATKPNLGVWGAFTGALLATVGHVMYSEGVYDTIKHKYKLSKERKKRSDLENYNFGENAINYFLDESEIGKLAPKLSKLINPLDIEWLTPDEMGWDRFNVGNLDTKLSNDPLAKFMVRAPKIGISSEGSTANIGNGLSRGLDLNRFQSGLIHLGQQLHNGKIAIYSQYRADACRIGGKKLPEELRGLLGDEISRVDIDPVTKEFGIDKISYSDMLGEVNSSMPNSLNEASRYSIKAGVGKSFYDCTQRRTDIKKDPPPLFTLEAVNNHEPE